MTTDEEIKFISTTLKHNDMPPAARQWLNKRFVHLLLKDFGKFPR